MEGINNQQAFYLIDSFRQTLVANPLKYCDQEINLTFSAGVTNEVVASLDKQINHADELLYQAKAKSRNCVIADDVYR
jgi:PleD family two-component response regulator